jgi:beta-glucosidase
LQCCLCWVQRRLFGRGWCAPTSPQDVLPDAAEGRCCKILYMRTSILVPLLALLPVLLTAQPSPTAPGANAPYRQASNSIEERVRDLLDRMTTEEKARQLDMYAGVPALIDKHVDNTHAAPDAQFQPEAATKLFGSLGVGSIHDLYPRAELANEIQRWVIERSRLGIPAIFIEEGLHGFSDGTVFPAPLNLAATWNPDLARQTGAAIAHEMRAAGVHMVLGPVLDVAREPRWGRVEEDFGEDPYLTGQLGLAYVQGAQGESLSSDHSVIAEPKHFVAHGSPESGLNTSPVHIGERELRTIMLKSFEPAIREGHAMGVMAAYHEIDGVPVASDPSLFTGVLRNEWGFRGFVLSDLGAIRRLWEDHHVAANPQQAIVEAINAGVDMQFYDFDHDVFQRAIASGIDDRTLSPQALDRAVSAVLRAKFELGLFDHPYTDPSLATRAKRSPEHLQLSLESARESLVLLKNEGHLLPLTKKVKSLAIIGPNAAIARYGDYEDEKNGRRISIADGIRALLPQTQITVDDGSDIQAAVDDARSAEVVIMALGEYQGISGESFDRQSLDLPGNQEAVLEAVAATGKPVVLVLENGRPLTIDWAARQIPAILEAWYPGEFGGQAVAEILFGDRNPSGKLTITFPRTVGQLPVFYNFDPSKTTKYVDGDRTPLFPFGYGLSYTSFVYNNLSVKTPDPDSNADIVSTVVVRNAGSIEGDEIAELYLHHDVSSVEVPDRALAAFERVHLRPGEGKIVVFHISQSQLAIWNAKHEWTVEKGPYTIFVGGSSLANLAAHFSMPINSAALTE